MSASHQLKAAATGQAVAKKEKPTTIHGFLEVYKGEIARALPKHMTADRMARIALTEFRKTPALMKCDPATLFGAVIQCAQLGLEPGGALGHAYLIPFENRKRGTTDVQFIVGYRGMIDLARRSGQIISLEAHAVYEGDTFECQFGLNSNLKHIPDWHNPNRADDAKLQFVYAVAKLKDGGTQFEVMSSAEVDAIKARSKAASYGPWVTDYAPMALKTVIRRLFKYLPVSIEMQQAVGLDEQADAGISQDNGMVIDGAFSEVQDEKPQADKGGAMTLEQQWAKYDQVLAEYGEKEAENFMPRQPRPVANGEVAPTYADVAEAINKAADADALALAADMIREVPEDQQAELTALYKQREEALAAGSKPQQTRRPPRQQVSME